MLFFRSLLQHHTHTVKNKNQFQPASNAEVSNTIDTGPHEEIIRSIKKSGRSFLMMTMPHNKMLRRQTLWAQAKEKREPVCRRAREAE